MILTEGSQILPEDQLYVVWEGGTWASRDGVEVGEYAAGEHFGELALLAAHHGTVKPRKGVYKQPYVFHRQSFFYGG